MEIIEAGTYYDIKKVEKKIVDVLEKFGEAAKTDFDRTTKTWKHDAPFITKKVERSRERAIQVYTEDEIFSILDSGTTVRYAVMSPDFVPKTRPGVLNSFPGQGGFAYMDKQKPRPGIKAREFAPTVKEKYERDFHLVMIKTNTDIAMSTFKRK